MHSTHKLAHAKQCNAVSFDLALIHGMYNPSTLISMLLELPCIICVVFMIVYTMIEYNIELEQTI